MCFVQGLGVHVHCGLESARAKSRALCGQRAACSAHALAKGGAGKAAEEPGAQSQAALSQASNTQCSVTPRWATGMP